MLSVIRHKAITAQHVAILTLSLSGTVLQAESLRDPTTPMNYTRAVQAEADKESLKLESVLIASQRSLAVINGQMVKVNDTVSGAKVLSIMPGKVVVLAKGERQALHVLPALNIKKVKR